MLVAAFAHQIIYYHLAQLLPAQESGMNSNCVIHIQPKLTEVTMYKVTQGDLILL